MKLSASDLADYLDPRKPSEEFDLSNRTPIGPEHLAFMSRVQGAEFDSERGIWRAHTLKIAAADPIGHFNSLSAGTTEINCWLSPRPNGAFYCQRYGSSVQEAATWSSSDGRTWCMVNEKPATPAERIRPTTILQLANDHPTLAVPIIGGLLRRGETMNLIADPKRGKSWLTYGLALSAGTGGKWLGAFDCTTCRVLLIDNELHPATLAYRLPLVADHMGIRLDQISDRLEVLTLRGRLMDLHGIAKVLESIERGTYQLVILDALYRALPNGISENDNATMAQLFNLIDQLAARLDCGWINVHHASKGNQSLKSVTDVGAVPGASAGGRYSLDPSRARRTRLRHSGIRRAIVSASTAVDAALVIPAVACRGWTRPQGGQGTGDEGRTTAGREGPRRLRGSHRGTSGRHGDATRVA